MTQGSMQLGKNKVTEEFLHTLKTRFEKNDVIRLSVLRSATRDREEFQTMIDKILQKLGNHYTIKKIGFTLVIKKWRKPVR